MTEIEKEIQNRLSRLRVEKEEIERIMSAKNHVGFSRIDGCLEFGENPYSDYLESFLEMKVGVPYFILESVVEGMKMISIIFVGFDPEDWKNEYIEPKGARLGLWYEMSYTFNLDIPEYSEFGYIGIYSKNGKIMRFW